MCIRDRINIGGENSLRVSSGVTLAGNRGQNGAPGPLLYTEVQLTGYALFFVADGARVTGIRLRGDAQPFSELFGMYPELFPNDFFKTEGRWKPRVVGLVAGGQCQIDNCEVSCFQTAIAISGADAYIHHNHVHDVHAYPIVVSRASRRPLIEANIVDWAWHAIATGDDMAASFLARYNLFREAAPNLWANGISGQFALDHHGLGEWFEAHHNTFIHLDRTKGAPNRSVALYPPWNIARIRNNWFRDYMRADEAVVWRPSRPMTERFKTLKDIVTARDLSRHMYDYMQAIQDYSQFDIRQMVATTRAGAGGKNMWIYDNAYGLEKDVLADTLFTTPRIALIHPAHGAVRTLKQRGRGGLTNAVLQHLSGKVVVDVNVEVLDGLELKNVTIDFITPNRDNLRSGTKSYVKYQYKPAESELERLYEGPEAPEPGDIVLDTRTVSYTHLRAHET